LPAFLSSSPKLKPFLDSSSNDRFLNQSSGFPRDIIGQSTASGFIDRIAFPIAIFKAAA
jgi:hypothetical protein